jgi:hypothetical protein
MRPAWHLSLLAALTACAACAGRPHVTLTAPAQTAPLEARIAAYRQLRLKSRIEVVKYDGRTIGSSTRSLILADGTRVYHFEDLLPVVSPDSATAKAVLESERLERRALPLLWGGAAAMMGSFALFQFTGDRLFEGDPITVGATLGLFVGGVVGGVFGRSYERRAQGARVDALAGLDDSLRENLGLCGEGGAVVDCASPPAAATAPASAPSPAPLP